MADSDPVGAIFVGVVTLKACSGFEDARIEGEATLFNSSPSWGEDMARAGFDGGSLAVLGRVMTDLERVLDGERNLSRMPLGESTVSCDLSSPDLNREKMEDDRADPLEGLSDTVKGFEGFESMVDVEGGVIAGKGRAGLDS